MLEKSAADSTGIAVDSNNAANRNVDQRDDNNNKVVDAADYALWRQTLGTTVVASSGTDGSGNGLVDQADYTVWRANFGNTTSADSAIAGATGSESSAVNHPPVLTTFSALGSKPEPASLAFNTAATVSLKLSLMVPKGPSLDPTGNNWFAFDLCGQVRAETGNRFFSSNSISIARAMTYGEAADALHP